MDVIEKATKKAKPQTKMYLWLITQQLSKTKNQLKHGHFGLFRGKKKRRKLAKAIRKWNHIQKLVKNRQMKKFTHGDSKLLLTGMSNKKQLLKIIKIFNATKLRDGIVYVFGIYYKTSSAPQQALLRRGTSKRIQSLRSLAKRKGKSLKK